MTRGGRRLRACVIGHSFVRRLRETIAHKAGRDDVRAAPRILRVDDTFEEIYVLGKSGYTLSEIRNDVFYAGGLRPDVVLINCGVCFNLCSNTCFNSMKITDYIRSFVSVFVDIVLQYLIAFTVCRIMCLILWGFSGKNLFQRGFYVTRTILIVDVRYAVYNHDFSFQIGVTVASIIYYGYLSSQY